MYIVVMATRSVVVWTQ